MLLFYCAYAVSTDTLCLWCSVAGVFALLNAYAVLSYIRAYMTKSEFKSLFFFAVTFAAGLVFLGVVFLTYAGK